MAEPNPTQNNTQTQTQTQTQTPPVVFTQADVDRIVQDRLSRAKPAVEESELAEFRKWKSSQKTQEQKMAEKEAELVAAQAEVKQLKVQGKIAAAEAKPEFVEFVTAQIMAMQGDDIDANIKAYKKDHPQYFGVVQTVKKKTSPNLSGGEGGDSTTNDIMNALLRNRGRAEN